MGKPRRIAIVVGTRPNFIKVTRFKSVSERMEDIGVEIVHTGQHYDEQMAQVFFDQFGLRPDVFLDIERGEPSRQIADTIEKLGTYFLERKPDLVLVVGDVNSTLAGAIAANKCGLRLGHLESGLRSFDRSMPEEHNRKVADHLADLHFVTEDSGLLNLANEGITGSGVHFVGNTMIDTLVEFKSAIETSSVLRDLNVQEGNYALVTMHRPGNVDSEEGLKRVMKIIELTASSLPVVFAAHPRTRSRMESFGLVKAFSSIPALKIVPPLGYFDFQKLIASCQFVLTDSGGIQEETTFLRKPCLTLRPNTERPVTVDTGTNTLIPFDHDKIFAAIESIRVGSYKTGVVPAMWDGQATERILTRISSYFETGT